MHQTDLDDMRNRRKLQTLRLMEVIDLTKQLITAVERRDQVSVNMLLTMRQEPVSQLSELEEGVKRRLSELPQQDAIRMNELLKNAPPDAPSEENFCEQQSQYKRLLSNALDLDRRLSLKLGGRKSFYNTFRDG